MSIKGNEFYKLREKDGRSLEYQDPLDLIREANEYFEKVLDNPLKEQVIVNKQSTKTNEKDGEIQTETTPYTKDYIEKRRPFTIEGLCNHLGIHTNTFRNYEKRSEFEDACARIRMVIDMQQFEGAASGFFNSSLIARRLGLIDKRDITSGGEALKSGTSEDDIDARIDKLLEKRKSDDSDDE